MPASALVHPDDVQRVIDEEGTEAGSVLVRQRLGLHPEAIIDPDMMHEVLLAPWHRALQGNGEEVARLCWLLVGDVDSLVVRLGLGVVPERESVWHGSTPQAVIDWANASTAFGRDVQPGLNAIAVLHDALHVILWAVNAVAFVRHQVLRVPFRPSLSFLSSYGLIGLDDAWWLVGRDGVLDDMGVRQGVDDPETGYRLIGIESWQLALSAKGLPYGGDSLLDDPEWLVSVVGKPYADAQAAMDRYWLTLDERGAHLAAVQGDEWRAGSVELSLPPAWRGLLLAPTWPLVMATRRAWLASLRQALRAWVEDERPAWTRGMTKGPLSRPTRR